MPFDCLALVPNRTLQGAASAAGLDLMDLEFLERHKAAELRRHPPGWAYRHRSRLQVAFGLTTVAGFVGFILCEAAGLATPAFTLAALLCILMSVVLAVPMHGPAAWEERAEADLRSVPPAVARAAERLQQQLPDVQFRVGELFQERVKLDPYLIAEYGDARLLIGIWDGDHVILCA